MTMIVDIFKSIWEFVRLLLIYSPLSFLLLVIGLFLIGYFFVREMKYDNYLLDHRCGRMSFEDWLKEKEKEKSKI